jgi:pilin isopeptide linkage protein/fibro-slime domain-containing protein
MLESKQPNHRGALRKNAAGRRSEASALHRTKKPLAMLVALATAVALMCGAAVPAYANPLSDAANAVASFFAGDQNADEGVSTQAVDDADHTVTGVSPRGTTINLFDYWISGQNDPDNSNPGNYLNRGINSQNPAFKFGGIGQSQAPYEANKNNVNNWTQSAHPRTGIVDDSLGEDGYPTLSSALGGDSLDYLFGSSSFDGKAVYSDVDGLLQIDEDGYYYYNSQENFAQFNDDGNGSGDFTLYNTWGVKKGGNSPDGQFFPLNTGNQVFDETPNGGITQKNINSKNSVINHYFGMHMSTRFIQQDGGYNAPAGTPGRQAVTYNFSGDDDVWIFIDGVLVGDLGGIHDATSIEINFVTGNVVVYGDKNNDNVFNDGDEAFSTQKLGQLLDYNMNTLPDETYHTLDFFYLERGNTDSNMSLKYNLVNIPESGVVKVDQYGKALGGVSFTLQQANEQYGIVQGGRSVSGQTDNQGQFIFTYENASGQEMPITLEQLNQVSDWWVLTENEVPAGYRSAGEMRLRFENGFLLSSNEWDTGAYSQPHVTVTAPNTLYGMLGDGGQGFEIQRTDDGFIFAVVLQKDEATNQWFPVSGNALDGWTVADSADTAAVAAAAQTNPDNYRFRLGSGGADEVTIDNLPGDVNTYSFVLANDDDPSNDGSAKYTVGYYYCADGNLENSSQNNIQRLYPDAQGSNGFDRIFSVTLNVPNIKNELTLVKTDADSDATKLSGSEFALYKADTFTSVENLGQAIKTFTTDSDGSFNVTTSGDLLEKGEYFLVETKATDGYELKQTPIQIVVDNDGVHVNAGEADDNVAVETGIGDLVSSMKGFAAGDDVDATLHDVNATAQTSGVYPPNAAWTDDPNATVSHFLYDDQVEDLSYKLNDSVKPNGFDGNGASTYTADAGWSRLNIQQCLNHSGDMTSSPKQDLSNEGVTDLNALFTGDVIIHVTNKKIPTTASLTIKKQVEGANAPTDAVFDFQVSFKDAQGTAVTGTFEAVTNDGEPQPIEIKANAEENIVSLKNSDTWTISGLPLGTTYTVTEKTDSSYMTAVEANPADASVQGATVSDEMDAAQDYIVTYTNTYYQDVTLDAGSTLKVVKNLTGKDLSGTAGDANNFEFTVTPVASDDGTTSADEARAKIAASIDGEQALSFRNSAATMTDDVATDAMYPIAGGMTFTAADDGKTFTYKVEETVPADAAANNNTLDGYTYDATEHTVTYAVSIVDGKLQVAVAADGVDVAQGGVATVEFNNSCQPASVTTPDPTGAGFSGKKTVTVESGNYTLVEGAFTFVITNTDAPKNVTAPMPSKATNGEVSNGTDGTFDFGAITFTEPGEYTYTVSEKTDNAISGITYSGEKYTLRFNVEDENGQLVIKDQPITNAAGETVNATDLNFTNIYNDGKVSYQIAGTKVFDNGGADNETLEAGDFTFALYEVGADGTETLVQKVENGTPTGSTASFTFDAITYEAESTHTYKVYELGADGQPGTGGTDANNVEYSKEIYTVKVAVTKDESAQGNNALAVSADVQNKDIVFTNTYKPTTVVVGPNGSAQIGGTKTLTGRDLEAGEFSFILRNGDQEVETVTNDANGNFVFSDLTFEKPGTYYYNVAEVNNGAGGVTYDEAIYTVRVDVTNNADTHALEAKVAYIDSADTTLESDSLAFANTYEAAGTTASLSVTKELKGGALAAGQFSFKLTGSDGAPMPEATTATNSANGAIVFGPIGYNEAGEYDYTITEVNDGQDGIVYDENTDRTVHVSVTDNGEGSLVAEVTYGEDGSHFVNEDTTGGTDPGDDPGKDPGENPGGDPGDGDGNGGNNGTGNGSGNGYQFAQTNDATPWPLIALVAFGAAAMIVVAAFGLRRARR